MSNGEQVVEKRHLTEERNPVRQAIFRAPGRPQANINSAMFRQSPGTPLRGVGNHDSHKAGQH